MKEQVINELETMHSAQKVERQMKTLTSLAETIHSEMRIEIEKLLDNAPLFSFETRELIKQFLESRQPGFKLDFLAVQPRRNQSRSKGFKSFMQIC